jgi:hypothetical protein
MNGAQEAGAGVDAGMDDWAQPGAMPTSSAVAAMAKVRFMNADQARVGMPPGPSGMS